MHTLASSKSERNRERALRFVTIGACPTCDGTGLRPEALAVTLVFFVVYQQLENHLLQPWIFSRTVKLNPLAVLVAILVARSSLGILGALLAIPAAGMIQVVVRDTWDHRRGRLKDEPTVGEELPRHGSGRWGRGGAHVTPARASYLVPGRAHDGQVAVRLLTAPSIADDEPANSPAGAHS